MTGRTDELVADMYFAVMPEWVLFSKDIKSTDKIVWGVLQRYANDKRLCWPSHDAIAEKANVSRRQVQNCIDRLVKAGMIEVRRRKRWVEKDGKHIYVNGTNVYTLRFSPPGAAGSAVAGGTTDRPDRTTEMAQTHQADFAGRGREISALSPEDQRAKIAQEPESPNHSNSRDIHVADADQSSVAAKSALRADADMNERDARDAPDAPAAAPRKKPALAAPREDVELLCNTLAEHLLRNGLRKQEVRINKTWREQARLMIDNDGAELQEILEVLEWCQTDAFWCTVIHSMTKFRNKYTQLRLQSQKKRPSRNVGHDRAERLRAFAEEADRVDNQQRQLGSGA